MMLLEIAMPVLELLRLGKQRVFAGVQHEHIGGVCVWWGCGTVPNQMALPSWRRNPRVAAD